jgi:hypothetical protein
VSQWHRKRLVKSQGYNLGATNLFCVRPCLLGCGISESIAGLLVFLLEPKKTSLTLDIGPSFGIGPKEKTEKKVTQNTEIPFKINSII